MELGDMETVSVAVNGTSDKKKACFPASSTVELGSGDVIPISVLRIGDTVKTGLNSVSEVVLFSHRERNSMHNFVQITVETGQTVTLSSGHYIHVGSHGQIVPAENVEIGDLLLLAGSGLWSPVSKKTRVRAAGLYNPHTIDGNVAVNGIVASTYTTAVHPRFAHLALMAPVRWIYRLPLQSTRVMLGEFLVEGSPILASILPDGPQKLNF
eukprot:Plantae.Rhodophyta-Palmaria_palmata.ctg422.p1 GENE.Plantae.Rhodophyta-Palmaria_palmata.ctg422~~Plantae.Rhodophyta-Palmaria_palmata.ctg422.p1  ORF type:complete len:211 (-),score=13.13 Plantae.Rhodophyta-Palmaria_palmata.ctg422:96-728(-)